jgi:membrane protease YdiL (CAAX protease family)
VVFALIHLSHRLLIKEMNLGDATLAALGLLPPALLLGFIMLRTQNIVASGIFHTFINWANDTL